MNWRPRGRSSASRASFLHPLAGHRFRTAVYGHPLETPFGAAAGPHTQMAQNIVVAWLCGARFIELKTVQTLDHLEVTKPCIDMQDEGYNVEWSQELDIDQSFDEYLRAWVLIHALHRRLGFPGRPARRGLQHERGLRPGGAPQAEHAVVPRHQRDASGDLACYIASWRVTARGARGAPSRRSPTT